MLCLHVASLRHWEGCHIDNCLQMPRQRAMKVMHRSGQPPVPKERYNVWSEYHWGTNGEDCVDWLRKLLGHPHVLAQGHNALWHNCCQCPCSHTKGAESMDAATEQSSRNAAVVHPDPWCAILGGRRPMPSPLQAPVPDRPPPPPPPPTGTHAFGLQCAASGPLAKAR